MELLPFFLLRSLYTPPDGPDAVQAAVRDALAEHLLALPGGYGDVHGPLTAALLDGLDEARLRR